MFHLRRLNKTLQTPSLSRSFARYMSSSVNNPCGSDFGIERMHTGPRMSKIVKHNNVVYLCGQTSDFPEGVTELSVAEQTQSCLDKIDDLLAEAGSSKVCWSRCVCIS